MSKSITMQGLTLPAIIASQKHNLMLDSTKNHDKVTAVRNLGQGHQVIGCLKSKSRTITVQGMTLAAITPSEKCTLELDTR